MCERPGLLPLLLSCGLLAACGTSSNNCTINNVIIPLNAVANPSAAAPGNQAQFSLAVKEMGNCPLVADFGGVWSTSDPVNTSISNQAPTQGLAICLNATPTPVTITNTSRTGGIPFPSAILVCK